MPMMHLKLNILKMQKTMLLPKHTVAIMQPYLLPYIGYFQLIAAVDTFVIYDNIKYTKKGWINRNRFLQNNTDVLFSLPLKNASDQLQICEREVADNFLAHKLLRQFAIAYQRAPYFNKVYALLEMIFTYTEKNLFSFLYHSVMLTCQYLGITTTIRVSSSIAIDHTLKSQDKVLALCTALNASHYINSMGGQTLYTKEAFAQKNIALYFLQTKPFEYSQFNNVFVPWLSIIDVLMFNSPEVIHNTFLPHYELV